MFHSKTLIHLFLCLALILNGIGAAMASAGMAMAAVNSNAPVAEPAGKRAGSQEPALQSDCHESDSSTANSSEHVSPDDCCKYGGCGCGCAHQSQVVLATVFLVTPAIAPALLPPERLATSPSPSLLRPVRPPIA